MYECKCGVTLEVIDKIRDYGGKLIIRYSCAICGNESDYSYREGELWVRKANMTVWEYMFKEYKIKLVGSFGMENK